jgi:hypothetical protein
MLVESATVWRVFKYHDFMKVLTFGEYSNIMILCEETINVTHYKNIKLIFTMHPPLINMDLQEGMIIKGI